MLSATLMIEKGLDVSCNCMVYVLRDAEGRHAQISVGETEHFMLAAFKSAGSALGFAMQHQLNVEPVREHRCHLNNLVTEIPGCVGYELVE